ncbi:pentatricopeptide repeat-containing protein At2g34400-like [Aristolochia californica]|uniref:pentatricopeptide repeat-containing protein At2g34400-like n=1 Tax=Aristolochia californica TaxID=171875 RepID=UPI0035E2E9A7
MWVLWHTMRAGFCRKDVMSWNTILNGFPKNGLVDGAIKLFHVLGKSEGILVDQGTIISLLPALSHLGSMRQGMVIPGRTIWTGLLYEVFVVTCLIYMDAKCGEIKIVHYVLDRMDQKVLLAWNALTNGHWKLGDPWAIVYAKKRYATLEELGWTEVITNQLNPIWISKIGFVCQFETAQPLVCRVYDVGNQFHDMLVKVLQVDDTRRVFYQISQRNLNCWNTMMFGHCIHGYLAAMVGQSSNNEMGLISEGHKCFNEMLTISDISPKFAHFWCMPNLDPHATTQSEGSCKFGGLIFILDGAHSPTSMEVCEKWFSQAVQDDINQLSVDEQHHNIPNIKQEEEQNLPTNATDDTTSPGEDMETLHQAYPIFELENKLFLQGGVMLWTQ